MSSISKKVDFVGLISVTKANPNGDPLNGNRPRQTDDGYGEISDVAIKRKIRNRWLAMGESILIQSDDQRVDGFTSIRKRVENNEAMKAVRADEDEYCHIACQEWLDVRSFGQLFAFASKSKSKSKQDENKGVSRSVRGPVSIHPAFSVDPISIETMQITKSTNAEPGKAYQRGPDTMGLKHRVDFGLYILKGSISVQLAEKTGFSDEDAEKLKQALATLFFGDSSSARPEGSMEMVRLYWWEHNSKSGQYSPATVHNSIQVRKKENVQYPKSIDDYEIIQETLEGLTPQIIENYGYGSEQ